jgi:hypothetical protein
MAGCSSPKADVIFVLDSSGSIGESVFIQVRQFVVDVVRLFVVGSNNVRVSVVQFSSTAQTEFNLTAYNTTEQIVNATYRIPYLGGGIEDRLLLSVFVITCRLAQYIVQTISNCNYQLLNDCFRGN